MEPMPPPPPFPMPSSGGGSFSTLLDPYSPTPVAPNYAGWWSRVAATLIDGFIAIPFMIPGTVLLILSFVLGHDGTCGSTFDSSETCRQPNVGLLILGVLAFGVAYIAYYAILCRSLGRTGQTWGRKAMGYKVVDADTGQPIGALKALGRYLVSAILDGICYIGYLWPLLDPRKQKWSDKAMNTIAVKV